LFFGGVAKEGGREGGEERRSLGLSQGKCDMRRLNMGDILCIMFRG